MDLINGRTLRQRGGSAPCECWCGPRADVAVEGTAHKSAVTLPLRGYWSGPLRPPHRSAVTKPVQSVSSATSARMCKQVTPLAGLTTVQILVLAICAAVTRTKTSRRRSMINNCGAVAHHHAKNM